MRDPSAPVPWSRRQALSVGAAAGLVPFGCRGKAQPDDSGDSGEAAGTPERSAEPAPWSPGGTLDTDRFPFGVQVGDATPTGARVHLRTHSGPVSLEVAEAQGEAWEVVQSFDDLTTTALPVAAEPAGMAVVVDLTALLPDTAYSVVFRDGDARSVVARFRTALAEDGLRRVVFGATSCFGGNEPWPSLTAAAEEQLDFFCLLGDTVYADGSVDAADYRVHWDAALSTQGLIDVSGSTSLVVTWDDHEVDNNWTLESVGETRFQVARACFTEALPRREGTGGSGVWRRLQWGQTLDVFVLDGRAERDAARGEYLSPEQYTWLVDGVRGSSARFKIILNSVPITDLNALFSNLGAEDRWEGYPEQRAQLLEDLAGVAGVLWVTGDVHFGQVGYVDPEGGVAESVVEVLTGPVGSFQNVAADLFVGDPQYLWMSSAWNWCRFDCDPVAGTVRVTHVGDDGQPLHDITLSL